ncbi:MAG: 3,4-dihydroxy-2-butanone-4-phosphate synthase, partial [Gordonia sp. (in: high G+C Gram-positive bacteria)]
MAVTALSLGRPVLVTDHADRENEGDVVVSAASTSGEWIAWTIRHTSGLLCAPMPESWADRLELPLMVSQSRDPLRTAYTVTVDAAEGVTTGISALDRTTTLKTLADPTARASALTRPGHVLPLRARRGGVLERAGHTEAAVELCQLAGLPPVAGIAELVSDDGSMMRADEIAELARRVSIPVLAIADLIEYRSRHPAAAEPEPARVTRVGECWMRTRYGRFRVIAYRDSFTGAQHLALVRGISGSVPLVRVHSEWLTREAQGSQRCECGP